MFRSVQYVQHAQQRETRKKREPEKNVPEDFVPPNRRNPSDGNHRNLDELCVEIKRGSKQSVNGLALGVGSYLT